MTRDQGKVEEFARALEDTLSGPSSANASERWGHFRDAVYNAAMSTFGKKASKSADWFEAHLVELIPVIVEKRKALAAYKHGLPGERNLHVQMITPCSNNCCNGGL